MIEIERPSHEKLCEALQRHLEAQGVLEARASFILYQVDAGRRGYLLLSTDRSRRALEDGLKTSFGVKPQGTGLWVLLGHEASMIVDAWSRIIVG